MSKKTEATHNNNKCGSQGVAIISTTKNRPVRDMGIQYTSIFTNSIKDEGMFRDSGAGRDPEWISADTALLDNTNRLGTRIPGERKKETVNTDSPPHTHILHTTHTFSLSGTQKHTHAIIISCD